MDNENFKAAVLKYGEGYITEIAKQLLLNNKNATGLLLDSLDYRVIETADTIALEILANDYLYNVDKGRKPGSMPPVDNITKWVAARGINFKYKGRTLTQKQIGFAIAKSIQLKGIKPTNILKKAKASFLVNKAALNEVMNGAGIDVKKYVSGIISDAIKNLNQ